MSKELEQALAALAKAKPSPEAVKQLAADTVDSRETPYRGHHKREDPLVFTAERGQPTRLTLTNCTICGAVIQIQQFPHNNFPAWGEREHLEWHNDQERRLRKLEEGVTR